MRSFDVVIESPSKMARDVWRFFYLHTRHALICQRMEVQHRPSLRHKYRSDLVYDAYDRKLRTTQPTIPHDVARKALDAFMADLTVAHFSERL